MERDMFARFAEDLKRYGKSGVGRAEFELGRQDKNSLRYIPFEHINRDAKIVIVGITPGPTQLGLAYETAQSLLKAGRPADEVLREAKKHGGFGGPKVKPNLLKLLKHFSFDRILGVSQIESLWGSNARLMHTTSVVPHAAFTVKKGRETPFADDFEDVWSCDLFRECFLDCFVPSLAEINSNAMYIGLGRCPEQALAWCVAHGLLREEQVLGAFCHPSTNGGSTVKYFLREVRREDLKPKDPVRSRCDWLDDAYGRMRSVSASLLANAG